MDAELRKKIISGLVSESSKNDIPVEHNRVFEYRKNLQDVHRYEKICKVDSEQWGDEEWAAFEAWLKNGAGKTFESAVDGVLERKLLREQKEEDDKSAIRKKIISCLKF
jgi:hypothetical protein